MAIKSWNRKKCIWILLVAAVVFLVGCSSITDVKSSTIYVNKKGKVTSVIAEDFSKEHYDEAELKESVKKTIDSYNNKKGKQLVVLDKLVIKDKKVRAVMSYETCEDYQAFNNTTLFWGTVAKAQKEGYDFKAGFMDALGKKLEAEAVIKQNQEAMVIITNEPVDIQTEKKILYVSENAVIDGTNTAKVQAESDRDNENAKISIPDYAYIIYQP